ncbi:LexA family protein [Sphingomonas paucimobilis]|uniref:LexA repressor DNA-binding domain-containing protein n=1 Tax=Sphingomonas paucimobilis TaxID=13689 RepID=A0A7T3A9D3_SPHPI|nr:hypothetical protein [Sphingomonas paucimobilis]QPT08614.1 hypothetical protein I6G38_18155 [Sphingomonas paucimobilis]
MTPGQLHVLDCVREMLTCDVSPSVRDIAKACNISVSQAHVRIAALVDCGALERGAGKQRNLRLVGVPDLRAIPTDAIRAELARRGVTLDALSTRTRRAVGHEVTCAADTCGHVVQRGHLFCREHWFKLDAGLRHRILRAFAAKDVSTYQDLVAQARDEIDECTA